MYSHRYSERDRVYRIFVSSPFSLERLRSEALQAILTTNNMPIMIDLESAKQEGAKTIIHDSIQAADIYIILLGHRYGSLMSGEDISYTEWEYDLAQEGGLYTIHMLETRQDVDQKRGGLKRDNLKEKAERDNEKRYYQFYNKLESAEALLNYWSEDKPTEFGIRITNAINTAVEYLREKKPKLGLIPAKYYKNINALDTSISNELRAEIHAEFNLFDELDRRCAQATEQKKVVAEAVEKILAGGILHNHVDVYFDSGSSGICCMNRTGTRTST